jgi:serine/threonine protein kinase
MRKVIVENSDEMRILDNMKTWSKKDQMYFLPYDDKQKVNEELCLLHFPRKQRVFLRDNEKKCVKCIQEALRTLRKKGILHMDVHLENILMDKYKFYLIDFGISQRYDKTNEFHQFHYELKEDYFQLLWNMYFGCNKMIDDFRAFLGILQSVSVTKQKKLMRILNQSKIFSEKYNEKVKELMNNILNKKDYRLSKKSEKILIKLVLTRIYFIYILLLEPKSEKSKLYFGFL